MLPGSISMLSLNLAPSSSVTRGDVMLPCTLPVLDTTTIYEPWTSPMTDPSIFTVLAVTSALTSPLVPIVSSFDGSRTDPSTCPSITRLSSPSMSPLIRMLTPIRDDERTAGLVGLGLSCSGAVVRPDTIWAVYYDQRLGTRLYRQGNYEEAFHYLLTAARHGLKYAQAQLSYLYLTGVGGVEQDNEAAVGWLGVAATGKTMPEIRDYYKDLLAQVPEPLRDDADAVVTCRRRGPQLFCTFGDEITGDDPSSGRGAGPFENVSYGRYPLRQSGRPLSRNFNLPAAQYESLFEPKEPTYQ